MVKKVRTFESRMSTSRGDMKYFVRVPGGRLAIAFLHEGKVHFYSKRFGSVFEASRIGCSEDFLKIMSAMEVCLYGVLGPGCGTFTILLAETELGDYMTVRDFMASKMNCVDGESVSDYGKLSVRLPKLEKVGSGRFSSGGRGRHIVYLDVQGVRSKKKSIERK